MVQCQEREKTPQVHVPVTEFQRDVPSSDAHRPPGQVSSAHRCPLGQYCGALAATGVVAGDPPVLLGARQALFGLDHHHREPCEVDYRTGVLRRLDVSNVGLRRDLELLSALEVSVVVSVEEMDEAYMQGLEAWQRRRLPFETTSSPSVATPSTGTST